MFPLCGDCRADELSGNSGLATQLVMVNVKKRKGRVVIDSDSEDSASDDNLDQVFTLFKHSSSSAGFCCCVEANIDAKLLASLEQHKRLKN